MFPIFTDRIYTIDLEVRPLPQYEEEKYSIKSEETDEDQEDILEVENPNFTPWTSEIYGLGIAWGDNFDTESIYFTGVNIKSALEILSTNKIKLGAHNVLFDWMNAYYHHEFPLNFVTDSGVISLCVNNSDFIRSLGLKQTTERWYNVVTQDAELKAYLNNTYKIAASKYGKYIHLCPPDMIEKYCRLDAHYCWKIINDSPKWLKSDISVYMMLYINEVKITIQQFLNGILINKEGFEKSKEILETEINNINNEFFTNVELTPFIKSVQTLKFNKKQAELKVKVLDFDVWQAKEENKFNINSKTQLKQLFDSQQLHWNAQTQAFEYPYTNTFKDSRINNPNSPKLGTKFLHAYGIGGKILSDLGEKSTLLSHVERALEAAELDGRIHPHINLLGTKSGRISASGVNIVATPVGKALYGKNLIADEGWVVLCKDFKSLEPTILACLSNDPVLQYITYFGEGKEPFIKDDILWIDDVYVSSAYSASFMQKEIMQIDLKNWVKDSDTEKKKVKQTRSVSKTIVLATNYGAGATKIQQQLSEKLKIYESVKNIKDFQDAYWSTFSTAAQFKRKIEMEAKQNGFLINPGGFPLIFYDRPGGVIKGTHKALNRMIQSTAAFCMKLLLFFVYKRLKNRKDVIPAVGDWHDAWWGYVRIESVDEIDSLIEDALGDVNDTLKWPLKLRLDKNVGASFFDCK